MPKHPDLRDHFQRLAAQQRRTDTAFRENHDAFVRLQHEHLELKKRCASLDELIRTYACVINELALETRRYASRPPHRTGTLRR